MSIQNITALLDTPVHRLDVGPVAEASRVRMARLCKAWYLSVQLAHVCIVSNG